MNPSILLPEVQQFIQDNLNTDLTRLVLSKSPFPNVNTKELAEQIFAKKTAEKKLPVLAHTPGTYFPPKLALEQSSSEQTATYKSQLIKGNTLIDLTGGMGIDTYAFAHKAEKVIHVERQAELSAIAQHNAKVLGLTNIDFKVAEAEALLNNNSDHWDTVYLDPSRRVSGQKVFKLSDCEPNIVALQDSLLERSAQIMVKTAPLLDIKSGLSELNHVSEIHVVSVNNEMKELIWLMDKEVAGSEPSISCVSISNTAQKSFTFKLSEEKNYQIDQYATVQNYLYEPDAAWLKAGCFKLISKHYQVGKLHAHTHLYTSVSLVSDFPGRKFKVNRLLSYKEFCKLGAPKQANISSRNFPLKPAEIQAKHTIKDGGDLYVFFCTNSQDELIVIETQRA